VERERRVNRISRIDTVRESDEVPLSPPQVGAEDGFSYTLQELAETQCGYKNLKPVAQTGMSVALVVPGLKYTGTAAQTEISVLPDENRDRRVTGLVYRGT
jgi:hypothetical protein